MIKVRPYGGSGYEFTDVPAAQIGELFRLLNERVAYSGGVAVYPDNMTGSLVSLTLYYYPQAGVNTMAEARAHLDAIEAVVALLS